MSTVKKSTKATVVQKEAPTAPTAEELKQARANDSSEVIIVPSEDVTREMVIQLTPGRKPVFTFKGQWVGRDIRAVVANIYRAYRLHLREIRRALPTTNNQ